MFDTDRIITESQHTMGTFTVAAKTTVPDFPRPVDNTSTLQLSVQRCEYNIFMGKRLSGIVQTFHTA